MHKTLIIQSHRRPLPYPWITPCLASVRNWCNANGYDHRFYDDELFGFLPDSIPEELLSQRVIASDLARLYALQHALAEGYTTVVWMDADFLIFNPEGFELPDHPYAVGREVWVQHDERGRLKVYKKVHNAFLMFRDGNHFLAFYRETAERLLLHNRGTVPAQFIGPKLLTALHNIAQFPVLETAGMLSPPVVADMVRGGGPALDRFMEHSSRPIAAANLCISSCDKDEVSSDSMTQLIGYLLDRGI